MRLNGLSAPCLDGSGEFENVPTRVERCRWAGNGCGNPARGLHSSHSHLQEYRPLQRVIDTVAGAENSARRPSAVRRHPRCSRRWHARRLTSTTAVSAQPRDCVGYGTPYGIAVHCAPPRAPTEEAQAFVRARPGILRGSARPGTWHGPSPISTFAQARGGASRDTLKRRWRIGQAANQRHIRHTVEPGPYGLRAGRL
jgi:hypothetical protein